MGAVTVNPLAPRTGTCSQLPLPAQAERSATTDRATGADTTHLQKVAAGQRAARTATVPAFLRGQDSLFALPDTDCSARASVLHLPTTSAQQTTSAAPTQTTSATQAAR